MTLSAPGVRYVDCRRCKRHPGAPPLSGEFHGSQPEDEEVAQVCTADYLGMPKKVQEDEGQSSKSKSKSNHKEKGKSRDKGKGKGKDNHIDDDNAGNNDNGGDKRESGYSRIDSRGSDPLHWSEERYKRETNEAVNAFAASTIDALSDWSTWD